MSLPTQHAGTEPAPAASTPYSLRQVLAAAMTGATDALEAILSDPERFEAVPEDLPGSDYLLCVCAGVPCAVELRTMREVLPALPQTVSLPASPEWLLGIFPLRAQVIALVDPAPLLTGERLDRRGGAPTTGSGVHAGTAHQALLAGDEEATLAFVVTMVEHIVRLEAQQIGPATEAPGRLVARYVSGTAQPEADGTRFAVLDLRLLVQDTLAVLTEWETRSDG